MERDTNEPVMRLETSVGEFEATRDNSSLFRFFGRLAIYDHAFFITDEENNVGIYVFSAHPMFEDIADFMMMNDYPAHLNIREVAQCDLDAYENMIKKDIGTDLDGGVPDDWF